MTILRPILLFIAGFGVAHITMPIVATAIPNLPSAAPMLWGSAWTALLFSVTAVPAGR